MTKLPSDSARLQHALTRARWSVIQTGLITSGLALFGVYVLASRSNNVLVMDLYWGPRFPLGPLLVGIIAGCGYAAGSWWNGLRVRGKLLLIVLALQIAAYFAVQYAQYSALGIVSRATHEPVDFWTFFRYTTMKARMDSEGNFLPRAMEHLGYLQRLIEIALFCLSAVFAAFILVGKPRCKVCGSALRETTIASVPSWSKESLWPALCESARAGNARRFIDLLHGSPPPDGGAAARIDVNLIFCDVCGAGWIAPTFLDSTNHRTMLTDDSCPAERSFVAVLSNKAQRSLLQSAADTTA